MTFNPQDHISTIRTTQGDKEYLAVAYRLVWFRDSCPKGVIETEIVHLDLDRETAEDFMQWSNEAKCKVKVTRTAKGFVIFKATISDGKGGRATATKSEKAASFGENNYLEKCETGAVGRALAMLGFGTAFTGDELDERHRLADSPLDRNGGDTNKKHHN